MLYCSIVLIHISSFCFVFAIHNFFSCFPWKSSTKVYATQIGLKSFKFFSSISCIWYMAIKAQSIAGKKLISVCPFLLRSAAERRLSRGWELRGNVDSWVLCENSWIFSGCFGNCVYRSPFTVERCRWNHLCMHMRRIDYSCWSLASHSHPHARSHWPVLGLSLTAQLHLFNINDSIGPGGAAGGSMSGAIAERS